MQALATIQKDVAEEFQDWLYEEVLPSIRKTGGYDARENVRGGRKAPEGVGGDGPAKPPRGPEHRSEDWPAGG
jgi:prophage antirepressor-like protein